MNDPIPGLEDEAQLTIPEVVPPGSDLLSTAVRLANEYRRLSEESETKARELAQIEDKKKSISEKLLPELMASVGLTELSLQDGTKMGIKEEVFASVPKARMAAAAKWLKENNAGSILKEEVRVPNDALERLVEGNIPHELVASIHPSTLRAFAKERVEANDTNFPRELFGVHVVEKVVIKN